MLPAITASTGPGDRDTISNAESAKVKECAMVKLVTTFTISKVLRTRYKSIITNRTWSNPYRRCSRPIVRYIGRLGVASARWIRGSSPVIKSSSVSPLSRSRITRVSIRVRSSPTISMLCNSPSPQFSSDTSTNAPSVSLAETGVTSQLLASSSPKYRPSICGWRSEAS